LRNLITDVPGLKVGHAEDARLGSGATAIVFDVPAVGSIDVRGGGPGTRETALLDPAQTVEGIDAIALSGGSAFGLDAASGVQGWLKEQKRGFAVRGARVPIVPAAILFDLRPRTAADVSRGGARTVHQGQRAREHDARRRRHRRRVEQGAGHKIRVIQRRAYGLRNEQRRSLVPWITSQTVDGKASSRAPKSLTRAPLLLY
jgi:L-aminopeptidase/D-esterase-like protein